MATLYTVGHGRRGADELIAILRKARVERLVDVRAFPGSRRNPQFSKERLAATLESQRIAYDWQGKALGGFRKGDEASAHSALRHPMFRAYAQHMESDEFVQAMRALARLAETARVCVMCAESNPAQCHRSLMADWAVAHGHRVIHLLDEAGEREHVLNPAGHLENGRLIYGGAQNRLL